MSAANDVRLLIFDVDGVLTDGTIILDADGRESKVFSVRDGMGIRMAIEAGLTVAVLSARTAGAVDARMKQLKINCVIQGADNKAEGMVRVLEQTGIAAEHAAFLGDDILDLPALRRVGYPMAVADACAEAKAAAAYVTTQPGGRGAARDAVEHLLKAQCKWDMLVQRFADR